MKKFIFGLIIILVLAGIYTVYNITNNKVYCNCSSKCGYSCPYINDKEGCNGRCALQEDEKPAVCTEAC